MRTKEKHLWLRLTGEYWKYTASEGFLSSAVLYLLVAMGLIGFNDHHDLVSHGVLLGAILGLAVLAWAGCWLLRYEAIRCPRCGFNPTYKEVGDERLSEDYMRRKFRRMIACPRCGCSGAP